MVITASPPARGWDEGPGVAAVDQLVHGRTYGEWAAQGWQWALSLPAAAHPLFDTAGRSAGQPGPVWFLGARSCAIGDTTCSTTDVERTCAVPAGKALFFPVVRPGDREAAGRIRPPARRPGLSRGRPYDAYCWSAAWMTWARSSPGACAEEAA